MAQNGIDILGRGKTIRKIVIKKYVSENAPVATTEMLAHVNHELKRMKNRKPTDYTNLHNNHLKPLRKAGLLGDLLHAGTNEQGQLLKGYKIKKDIDTLKLLLYQVYFPEAFELMQTRYYGDLVPEIVNYVKKNMELIGYEIDEFNRELLENSLQVSIMTLNFSLSPMVYRYAIERKRRQLERMEYSFIKCGLGLGVGIATKCMETIGIENREEVESLINCHLQCIEEDPNIFKFTKKNEISALIHDFLVIDDVQSEMNASEMRHLKNTLNEIREEENRG